MQENFEHSLRYRSLRKKIEASRVVADMEDPAGRTIKGTGTVGFTQERAMDGTTSLRYTTPTPDWDFIRGDAARNGRYGGSSCKGSSAVLTIAFFIGPISFLPALPSACARHLPILLRNRLDRERDCFLECGIRLVHAG